VLISSVMMKNVSPERVGFDFVKQYYTNLSTTPAKLHRFYAAEKSTFSHGDEGEQNVSISGQQKIHEAIMELDLSECKTEIKQVDCQLGPENSVLIQVVGWLSKDGDSPLRKFCQTFCLQPETTGAKNQTVRFSIRNDIFRYLSDVFVEVPAETQETFSPQLEVSPIVSEDVVPEPTQTDEAMVVDIPPLEIKSGVESHNVSLAASPLPSPLPKTLTSKTLTTTVEDPEPTPVVEAAPKRSLEAQIELDNPAPPPEKKPEPVVTAVVEPEPPVVVEPKKPFSYASAAQKISAARPTPTAISQPKKSVAPATNGKSATNGNVSASNDQQQPPQQQQQQQQQQQPNDSKRGQQNKPVRGPSVYVKGLPQDCEVEDLRKVFEVYGKIKTTPNTNAFAFTKASTGRKNGLSIAIYPPKQGARPGQQAVGKYAFVEFEDNQSLKDCLADTREFKVNGRKIYVQERTQQNNKHFSGGGRGGRGGGRGGRGGGLPGGGRGSKTQ